jgi:hypothetical protein
MRSTIVGLTLLQLMLTHSAYAQTSQSPRGYPYDKTTCASGYQACFNRFVGVGWHSAAAGSYCSHACRDYPPSRRSR